MQATILLFGRCPVCGYRSGGVQVGTARPGMRQLTVQPGSIGWVPPSCAECGHPLDPALYDQLVLDAETTAAWRAWQDRQRQRRAGRKAAAS